MKTSLIKNSFIFSLKILLWNSKYSNSLRSIRLTDFIVNNSFHLHLKNGVFCLLYLGISTQTILTIPVSQQVNSNEQLAQTLAALNNCPSNQQVHQHQKQSQQSTSHQMPNLLGTPGLLAQQSQQPQKTQQGI